MKKRTDRSGKSARAGRAVPFRLKIEELSESGHGLGFYKKRTIRVPKTLPGEEVEVVYRSENPPRARIELKRILHPSPHRQNPPCRYFEDCGGCHLQHLAYPEQLRFKRQIVQRHFLEHPGLRPVTIHPVEGMPNPFYYRNKCQMPFRFQEGQVVYGLYQAGTHQLVALDECLVENRDANQALRVVRDWMRRFRILPYDERSGEGVVRHLLVRKGMFTNQVMVVLVVAREEVPHWQELLRDLKAGVPSLRSFQFNINTGQTNRILGERTLPVWGEACIEEQLGTLKFRIYLDTFFQINSVQTVKILERLQSRLQAPPEAHLLDLYAGVGILSLSLARQVAAVTGVELVPAAVQAARQNALDNGITNARFICGDAAQVAGELLAENRPADICLLNPPRKGVEPAVLEAIGKMRPEQIAYLSCHPRSLARDLSQLVEMGYRCEDVFLYDMFPQTYHVESLAFLRRQ
ncbi:MAG: 23S rRNA (uracil(1939)-C(5))-methyltransferase RlmD [Calditrichaeota bacterium]|nr:MAG: 23S rRNA (uracil(1939)-C(5))-methyltransferase RlmD [Calditrichota bacterium]